MTSPKTVNKISPILRRPKTAPFTCVQCLTLSSIWKLTLVTLDRYIESDVILFGTKTTALYSLLVPTTGLLEFGVLRNHSPNLHVTKLRLLNNKLMIFTGHLIPHLSSQVLQTTGESKFGTLRKIILPQLRLTLIKIVMERK